MMKYLALFVMTLIMSQAALAVDFGEITERPTGFDPDWACMDVCGQDTIAVSVFDLEENDFVEDFDFQDDSYVTKVLGDANSAEWKANPEVDCLFHKEGNQLFEHNGGTEGAFRAEAQGIEKVVMCGEVKEVPEMGFGAMLLAVIGALGVFAARKRN